MNHSCHWYFTLFHRFPFQRSTKDIPWGISFQTRCWQFQAHEPQRIFYSHLWKKSHINDKATGLQESHTRASTINTYWNWDSDVDDSWVFISVGFHNESLHWEEEILKLICLYFFVAFWSCLGLLKNVHLQLLRNLQWQNMLDVDGQLRRSEELKYHCRYMNCWSYLS